MDTGLRQHDRPFRQTASTQQPGAGTSPCPPEALCSYPFKPLATHPFRPG